MIRMVIKLQKNAVAVEEDFITKFWIPLVIMPLLKEKGEMKFNAEEVCLEIQISFPFLMTQKSRMILLKSNAFAKQIMSKQKI